MSVFIQKSDEQIALSTIQGFAHTWVRTEEHIYDFNREAVREECECGCEACGGFPLEQVADDEILLAPGAIYKQRKEASHG